MDIVKGVDGSNVIDWGQTSSDYALHRGGLPESFYEKLLVHGVGLEGQRILDLGTGTGNLAREFARNGSLVSGVDVSEGQISAAQRMGREQGLSIDFRVSGAESLSFADDSFDCVTANQCFLYFDKDKALAEARRVLKDKGLLVLSYFSWLPRLDKVVRESEKLILAHNPRWSASDYDGVPASYYKLVELGLVHRAMFFYDARIPFTKEGWRGRIRASRGVGASMSPEQVERFDREHVALLDGLVEGDSFSVLHRIDVNIFSFGDYETVYE